MASQGSRFRVPHASSGYRFAGSGSHTPDDAAPVVVYRERAPLMQRCPVCYIQSEKLRRELSRKLNVDIPMSVWHDE